MKFKETSLFSQQGLNFDAIYQWILAVTEVLTLTFHKPFNDILRIEIYPSRINL